MKLINLRVDEIVPYPENNRENAETVDVLVKLIQRVGFNVPLVVDKKNVIVKGHARWKAAKKLGMETVPAYVSENSDELNNLDRIADNKVSELAQWDAQLLQYELQAVDSDLRELGIEFNILPQTHHEVTQEEVEESESRMFSLPEDDVDAMLTVECPECGGHFEYKPIVKS